MLHLQRMKSASHLKFALAIIAFFLTACKKEPTSWDLHTAVPIAEGSIQFYNAIADSLIEVGQNGEVNLVLNTELLALEVDTLFQLPDTTTEQFFLIPIGPIDFPPGHVLFSDTQNTVFNISQADLSRAIAQQGQLEIEVKSTIGEVTVFTYNLPYVTKNGVPFSYSGNIPAGTLSNPSSQTVVFDLSGYDLDLRGINQNKYNTLVANYIIQIDPNGAITTIFPGDYYRINITSKNLVPTYARGILETRTESESASEKLDLFNQILQGGIDLSRATIDLEIINEVGVDMTVNINELSCENTETNVKVNLDAPIIGQGINLTRAKEPNGPANGYQGYEYNSRLTTSNSNVAAFISNLPDLITYDIDFKVNPLGASSAGNDFLYFGSGVRLNIDANIPLALRSQNIVVSDTSIFSLNDSSEVDELDPIQGGDLYFYLSNSYPMDTYAQFYFLDSNFIVLDSAFIQASLMNGAVPEANGRVSKPVETVIGMPLSQDKIEHIENASHLVFQGSFTTTNQPDTLQFYNDYIINYQVTGEIEYRVNID